VLVADCLPVLFAARDGSAIGIAHAGWRGLAAGVLEATVRALSGHGMLQAWLGPAIGPAHFEVGEEVRAIFLAHAAGSATAFTPNARGRWQCDLAALARARLEGLGVARIDADERCSFAEPQHFYSYRRDGTTGRMAALIWLR
ncbi:MAG: laccase domain-containing protein, partial [Steroidobacteraceae bacterium]